MSSIEKTVRLLARPALYALCVCALLVHAGCTKKQQRTEAPDYGDMQWNESLETESHGVPAPAFAATAAGDQLVFRTSMYGIEIGRVAMAVGQPGTYEGHPAVIVSTEFQSTAAAAIFAPLMSQLTTSVDTTTLTPLYHRREVETGTVFKWVEVTFTPNEFVIDYRRRALDTDSQDRQTVPPGAPLFDVNALLLAARTWDLELGKPIVVNVFREIYIWSLQVERVGAAEPIKTRLGEFPAIRHNAIGRQLGRDGSVDQSEPARQYSYWITDDDRRLPILIIAKSDYGDVRLELVQYDKASAPTP